MAKETQRTRRRNGRLGLRCVCVWLLFGLSTALVWAEDVSIRLHIDRTQKHATANMSHDRELLTPNAVVWLTPVDGSTGPVRVATQHEPYRLLQKGKQFLPHVLVVPTGTSVEFPNLDPYFHNVFSLFNGKRFDLGLYEAGSHRSVRFDREGVSYIFCNIHPEMGAVVVSLNTPYYAVAAAGGVTTLHGIPPGTYRMHLWAEDVATEELQAAERQVQVEGSPKQIAEIRLKAVVHTMADHKNKFGDDYKSPASNPY